MVSRAQNKKLLLGRNAEGVFGGEISKLLVSTHQYTMVFQLILAKATVNHLWVYALSHGSCFVVLYGFQLTK